MPEGLEEADHVLEEERDADRRDQGDQPRRVPQRAIRDAFDGDRQQAAPRHADEEGQQEHERPRDGVERAKALQPKEELDADERADDEDLGVGEVDELQHAVHHRVAEGDQRVHESQDDAVEDDLREDIDEELEIHALAAGAGASPRRI